MKYIPHIFIVAVVIIAGVFLWRRFGPAPDPVLPPASGTVPVVQLPHVTHGSAVLPKPDEHTTGVLHITVSPDTVAGVAMGKPREVYVYLTDVPDKPPLVQSDSPIQSTFAPVVDPWLRFKVRFMAGVSVDRFGGVSPYGGVSLVRLFRAVDLGAGIDGNGAGVLASYQFWREFSIGAVWYAFPLFDADARAAVVLTYTF